MRKCFECFASRQVDPQECLTTVRIEPAQPTEQGVSRWLVTQSCTDGVVSLKTDVRGNYITAMSHADAIVSRRRLRPMQSHNPA